MMSWCLERPRGHNDNKDTFYQPLTDKQLAIDTEAYQSFLGPTNACKILPLLPACMQQYSRKIPFVVMNYSGLGKASFPIQRRARDKKARVVRLTCCLGVFCIKIAHLPTHLEFKSDTMALANVVLPNNFHFADCSEIPFLCLLLGNYHTNSILLFNQWENFLTVNLPLAR